MPYRTSLSLTDQDYSVLSRGAESPMEIFGSGRAVLGKTKIGRRVFLIDNVELDPLRRRDILRPRRAQHFEKGFHLLIVVVPCPAEPKQDGKGSLRHFGDHAGTEISHAVNMAVLRCSVLLLLLQNAGDEIPDGIRLQILIAVAGNPEQSSGARQTENFLRASDLGVRCFYDPLERQSAISSKSSCWHAKGSRWLSTRAVP